MAGQISGTNENLENETPVDPWAEAFATLESKGEKAAETASGTDGGQDPHAGNADGAEPDIPQGGNGDANEDDTGGLDSPSGDDGVKSEKGFGGVFDIEVDEDSIREYEDNLNKELRDQAIGEVAREFVKRGVRNRNGRLGASLDDPDICKRDGDGVPRFYNPETGREFAGDNPRRQAQEWVDDYNKELARVFNEACEKYESHLKEDSAPQLAVMKFAPKYAKLDDIRRGMFDSIVEDYEIRDSNGDPVGYDIDLDKALALVDRQIAMIQDYAKSHSSHVAERPAEPILDMKTSSGAMSDAPVKIDSLAAAMEHLQNKQLEKLKTN